MLTLKENKIYEESLINELFDCTSTLSELLNNTLDISKLEEGKIEFNTNYEKIEKIIAVSLNITKPLAKRKKISIKTEFTKYQPEKIEIDKTRLGQVITNILNNAIKFTKENGTIQIFTKWYYKCLFSGDCENCVNSIVSPKIPQIKDSPEQYEDISIPQENISIEIPTFVCTPKNMYQTAIQRQHSENPMQVFYSIY